MRRALSKIPVPLLVVSWLLGAAAIVLSDHLVLEWEPGLPPGPRAVGWIHTAFRIAVVAVLVVLSVARLRARGRERR